MKNNPSPQLQNPGKQMNPDPTVPQPKDPNPDQPVAGTKTVQGQNQPSDSTGTKKQPIGYNTNQREENGKKTGDEPDDEDIVEDDDRDEEEFDDEDDVMSDEEE